MAVAPLEDDGGSMRGWGRRGVWLPLSLVGLAFLGALYPLLDLSRSPGFRDAGHYYGPLYAWQAEQWHQGEWPFWSEAEDAGRSLAADPTAATFYPPKLALFSLPGSWTWRWHLYLIGHVLLAGWGAAWCARRLGCSVWGSSTAAIAYGTSGVVLSQIDNVVFLVGAAWFPWVLGSGERALREGSLRAISGTSLALAMMVLGGDPQAAVHGVLALMLLLPLLGSSEAARVPDSRSSSESGPLRGLQCCVDAIWRRRGALGRLSLILGMAAGAAAIQVVPSWRAAANSERRLHRDPRSVSEALVDAWNRQDRTPREKLEGTLRGWFGRPLPGTHHEFATQFSIPPWQFAELLWPTISGRGAPIDRRWTEALPAADRVWFPTLHLGTAAFLLVVLGWSVRRVAGVTRRWCSWGGLCFALMALGWYGPGWVCQEGLSAVFGSDGQSIQISGAVGGPYWWVTLWVPGYCEFRYPAKAFVPAACFLSMVAGLGWESLRHGKGSRLTLIGMAVVVLTIAVGGLAWSWEGAWRDWLAERRPDAIWGRFDVEGAWRELVGGLLHGGVVAALVTGLAAWISRGAASGNWESVGVAGLLGLMVLETAVARRDLILTAPVEAWATPSPLLAIRETGDAVDGKPGLRLSRYFRSLDDTWTPRQWWSTSDPHRMDQVIAWDRVSWFPKHHLRDAVISIETPGSSQDAARWLAFQIARGRGFDNQRGAREPDPAWLSALGAEWLVVSAEDEGIWGTQQPHLERYVPRGEWPEDLVLLHDPQALPVAWLVTESRLLPLPKETSDLDAWWRLIDRLFRDTRNGPRGWSERVMLHGAEPDDGMEGSEVALRSVPSSVRQVSRQWHRSEWELEVAQPSWMVLSEAWSEDWRCWVEDAGGQLREAEVLRANLVMRAVRVLPGDRRVVWEFRPSWMAWAAAVSLVSGCGLVLGIMRRKRV